MNKLDNNLLSIICILVGMSIFSIQDVLIRLLSNEVSTFQILFTRSIIGSFLLIAYLRVMKIKIEFSTNYLFLTIFRGIIFLFGFALFYVG
jgi:drug/metabolite transporter (DMT)-like permease